MRFVFEFARLVLCRTECCGTIPRKSVIRFSPIRKFKLDQKNPKRKSAGGRILLIVQNNEFLDVDQIFEQNTLELVAIRFLSVRSTTFPASQHGFFHVKTARFVRWHHSLPTL